MLNDEDEVDDVELDARSFMVPLNLSINQNKKCLDQVNGTTSMFSEIGI